MDWKNIYQQFCPRIAGEKREKNIGNEFENNLLDEKMLFQEGGFEGSVKHTRR